MTKLLRDRLFLAWLLLVAVTVLSSAIGGPTSIMAALEGRIVTTIVLGIAFAKVAVVIYEFMEVGSAPVLLKILCAAWLAVVLSVLLLLYFRILHLA